MENKFIDPAYIQLYTSKGKIKYGEEFQLSDLIQERNQLHYTILPFTL